MGENEGVRKGREGEREGEGERILHQRPVGSHHIPSGCARHPPACPHCLVESAGVTQCNTL